MRAPLPVAVKIVVRPLRSAATLSRGAAAPSTADQAVDIVPFMTARWERRVVRLAWGIGLRSLGPTPVGAHRLAAA